MKTFLLLAASFSIALTQTINAEDQDQVKPPKSRAKVQTQQVAPRVTPRTQRNIPSTSVVPRVNRWQQPPVNQPNVQATARVRTNPDMPRTNRWRQSPVNQPNVQADARLRANPDVPRTFNQTPQTTATVQPDLNGRNRNWDNTRNSNNSNWRNRFPNNNSWAEARRLHPRQHHHRDWWRSHFTRFALFGTGYYFWDNGYWYPAYGYDPAYDTYAYEEPIYGYGDLEPAQVIANVQTELQRLGYYPYAVDGEMGPMTRAAIANYQRDNGLAITSAIDGPTLDSLGLE
jgi:Putative peptidoglycan binding domain